MAHQYDLGVLDGSGRRIPEVVGRKRSESVSSKHSLALRKEKPLPLRTAPLSLWSPHANHAAGELH